MKRLLVKAGLVLISGLALQMPVQAQGVPEISPSLKKMLGALPIEGYKDDVQGLVKTLKKTACANLNGCYSTKSGPLQLYFFTSSTAQQTFLLVINTKLALPKLLKDNVQKVLGGTSLSDPIISISTTDFDLDTAKMPADLQKIVRDSYFDVNSLAFSSGVQLAGRADLGGVMKATLKSLGVDSDKMTLRAAVVMPIPTDIASGAGAAAGLADSLAHSETMKKSGKKALTPEAFVEFQLAPGSTVNMTAPYMALTDATFFLNNDLKFGYKGNARFKGTQKDILLQFQTPLNPTPTNPMGAMDLLDFSFRMAMPQSFTLEDYANMSVAMVMQDRGTMNAAAVASLDSLGGFIGQINAIKKPLLAAAKPLSVFQLRNPKPPVAYKFGDRTKPFPTNDDPFNVMLLGPSTKGGPLMHVASDVKILGQTMGKMEVSAGIKGFHGMAEADIVLKMGPLGKTSVKMQALADITGKEQDISLKGNLMGQKLAIVLAGESLTIDLSASCVNPFEIKVKVAIEETMDIAKIFEGEAGANVDPSKISGCLGKELEAAYNKIANVYKGTTGYTANAANTELTKISNDAAAAARQTYENTKNAARNVANSSSNTANNALKTADNVFKGFGKKKKHKKGPDPKFAATVFDWDFYYDYYPELVAQGVDLATHWRDTGFAQGRQGSFEFNATFYIKRYADVQRACSGNLQCALQHWLDFGIDEGRQATWEFSISSYLARYADLRAQYPNGDFAGAFEHWFATGIPENRSGTPLQQWNGTLQGPGVVGGGSGQALWNDINICADAPLSAFRLRYGGSIDAIQFGYVNSWAQVHGYQSNDPFRVEVGLPSDEHFTEVRVGAGSRVDNITFYTNKGRKFGPYGGGQPNGGYKAEPGESIGCMAGRSGGSVDQLIFTSTGPR
ncbi:MAG: lectin [Rhodoferax sp.]|uniref:jacalin-like lectin n=1 Tax=Rhodoferax sp. TaxID=50421 RepID=UPI0026228FC6|nr:lectin [Rhodoferax sp.]MDD2880835.1 lectin [Rhodoferax sp.]